MFYARLEEICEQRGEKLTPIIKKLGYSSGNITRWKNGTTPNGDVLLKFSEYFDVPIDYLLGKTDNPDPVDEWIKKNTTPARLTHRLPILGSVSAGNGCFAEEDILGYEFVDERYADDNHFFLRVRGDSMSPKIDEGDIVLVRKQSAVDSGSIAVLIIDDDEGVLKRVVSGNSWIELHSLNTYYPLRRFEGREVERVRVIGLVLKRETKFC